jgi:hypothetical protein
MFTTGSKLFLGATTASAVGAVVWAVTTGGSAGILGAVGLATLAVVFAFLAGLNFFTRDGNVPSTQPNPEHTTAAGQYPVGGSLWPMVTAVSLGGIVVGAVSRPVVFKVSVVILLAALVEWMVQGFAERASADPAYNAGIRKRLLHPLEFPIFGALVLGVVVYGFSRVMLSASKDSGRIVFILLGTIIVVAGFLIAGARGMAKGTSIGIAVVGGVALLSVGVVSAVQGQRTIAPHPELTAAVCLGNATPEQEAEVDKNASQNVAAKSSVVANVVLTKDNRLVAFINGIPGTEYHEITIGRSAQTNILFRNDSSTPHRLTARLGTFVQQDGTAGNEEASCTARLNQNNEGFLSFKLSRQQAASSTPFELIIPGLTGQSIKLLVP